MFHVVIRAYFIHISQGSVETHFRCGGIYNTHVIANCPWSVTVKEVCAYIVAKLYIVHY